MRNRLAGLALAISLGAIHVVAAAGQSEVAKLIAQLGASDFRSRDQAAKELETLGDSILPALRKATAVPDIALDTKRRIESVADRIESNLLKAEEKDWLELDAPRRSLRERVLKILGKTPTLDDQKVATVLYLVCAGRPPTEAEVLQAQKQFKERNHRLLPTLQLARSLVNGKDFNADLAAANARLLKTQKELAGEYVQKLALLNNDEIQKLIRALSAAASKAAITEEQYCDLAFLVVLSRFPDANQSTSIINHLKNAKNRANAREDIIWALINTKEFIMAP